MTTQAKHTPEPWRPGWVSGSGHYYETHRHMCGPDGEAIGGPADIDRAVACVNALEGIADPAALRAQRDDVLTACTHILACDTFAIPGDGQMRKAVEALRVVLNKATP